MMDKVWGKNMFEGQEILRRALNLTLAIYRVTERFPIGEVLAKELRKVTNEIGGDLVMGEMSAANKKIDRLLFYFKIAQAQNWVRPINWLILGNEYARLKQTVALRQLESEKGRVEEKKAEPADMSHNIGEAKQPVSKRILPSRELSVRQEKILQIFKDKKSIKMADLASLFKNMASERTLRNDLRDLANKGLIYKLGNNKFAKYLLK